MKPIQLTMSAFGPFAGRVCLDMRPLSEAGGIFLVTGNTGAGKTTLFDAIAFALFGDVSGSYREVSTLRSDYAKATTPTFVELVFSHKGKEYTVTRNPEYLRPKRRGEGQTALKADATLQLPGGTTVTKTRQVTARVEEILGINRDQFRQIAMIAQGEFQKLLHAKSEDRAAILRQVFDTRLYQAVQGRAKEVADAALQACEQNRREVAGLVQSAACPPDHPLAAQLAAVQDEQAYRAGEALSLLDALNAQDAQALRALEKDMADMETQSQQLAAKGERAKHINALHARLAAAQEDAAALAARTQEMQRTARDVAHWEKALGALLPLWQAVQREQQEVDRLEIQLRQLSDRDKALQREAQHQALALARQQQNQPAVERLTADIAALCATLPAYAQAEALGAVVSQLQEELRRLRSHKDACAARKAKWEQQLAGIRDTLTQTAPAAAQLVELCAQSDALELLFERNRQLQTQTHTAAQAQTHCGAAQAAYKQADAAHVQALAACTQVERAYRDNQAGLLAAALQPGQPCPVCGATQHPCPAQLTANAATAQAVEDAQADLRAAEQALRAATRAAGQQSAQAQTLAQQVCADTAAHLAQSGTLPDAPPCDTLAGVQAALTQDAQLLTALLERLTQAAQHAHAQAKAHNQAQQDGRQAEIALSTADADLAKLEAAQADAAPALARRQQELLSRKEGLLFADAAAAQAQLARLEQEKDALQAAYTTAQQAAQAADSAVRSNHALQEDALLRQQKAQRQRQQAGVDFEAALQSAGFADAAAFQSACVPEQTLRDAKAALQQYDQQCAANRQSMEQLTQDLDGAQAVDMDGIQRSLEDLQRRRRLAQAQQLQLHGRLDGNQAIRARLAAALAAGADEEARAAQLKQLYDTLRGKAAGKQKIGFEQYVQTAHFATILAAANRRLKTMTDGQFQLLRREGEGIGRACALDLDVLDYHTGKARPASSLSGGESFKAALALALGLSDVIQSAAGGIRIDTLFLDEGFGSLDSDSLDKAIRVLTGLSGAGRSIGIISHVAELKERIDRQIVVTKTAAGSRVDIAGLE